MTATIALINLLDLGYREIQIVTTVIASVILTLTIVYFLAVSIGPYFSRRLEREFPEQTYPQNPEENSEESD